MKSGKKLFTAVKSSEEKTRDGGQRVECLK